MNLLKRFVRNDNADFDESYDENELYVMPEDLEIPEAEAKRIGLEIVPFDAGFFVSIPMPNSDEVAKALEKEDIFLVPLAKGLRVSVASVPEDICRILPARIKAVMDKLSKYLGGGENPTLNKIGGGEFERIKELLKIK